MPQFANEEVHWYIYRQEGAPPHWHNDFLGYLNEHLHGRCVVRAAATDNTGCTWPPRSPDLNSVRDFFLWRFVKDSVYVPPLPKTLPELQRAHRHSNRERHTRHALRGFEGDGSIDCTSAVSHVGRTSSAFKVTMKLQTFLFKMVVTSYIYVQYLWKYGFEKSSDNLCTPCTMRIGTGTLIDAGKTVGIVVKFWVVNARVISGGYTRIWLMNPLNMWQNSNIVTKARSGNSCLYFGPEISVLLCNM